MAKCPVSERFRYTQDKNIVHFLEENHFPFTTPPSREIIRAILNDRGRRHNQNSPEISKQDDSSKKQKLPEGNFYYPPDRKPWYRRIFRK